MKVKKEKHPFNTTLPIPTHTPQYKFPKVETTETRSTNTPLRSHAPKHRPSHCTPKPPTAAANAAPHTESTTRPARERKPGTQRRWNPKKSHDHWPTKQTPKKAKHAAVLNTAERPRKSPPQEKSTNRKTNTKPQPTTDPAKRRALVLRAP